MKNKILILGAAALLSAGCSPLRTSEHDEKHQWELRFHEVQTNLDDFRHDINCLQTELQIVDGRIRYYETALSNFKQQEMEKQQARVDHLGAQVAALEKKWSSLEKGEGGKVEALQNLSSHANETSAALLQFRARLQEIEKALSLHKERLAKLDKLQDNLDSITRSLDEPYTVHRVASGDTLEKIARHYKTDVDKIRKLNHLSTDLIFIGQELKVPL